MAQNPPSRKRSSSATPSSPSKVPKSPSKDKKSSRAQISKADLENDSSAPNTPKTPSCSSSSSPKKAFGQKPQTKTNSLTKTSSLFSSAITSTISPEIKNTILNLTTLSNPEEVTRRAYAIVNQFTGQIGGNGSGGPIYGELTIGSMQRVTEIMKRHCNLTPDSMFIDVGAGLGKPNIHVACDPGVKFSYGIEVERTRWLLSLANMRGILKDTLKSPELWTQGNNTCLEVGNIFKASSFNPFTHVYMFDVGFPENLCEHLSQIFNISKTANYLISYHLSPRLIKKYKFDVEYICQITTSMHGSGEGHTAYFYKRTGVDDDGNRTKQSVKRSILADSDSEDEDKDKDKDKAIPCDPAFKAAWDRVKGPIEPMVEWVASEMAIFEDAGRPKRTGDHTRKKYNAGS